MEIGRNDPCSCGSGKKYKKCCLNKPAEVVRPIEAPVSRKEAGDRGEGPIITRYPGDFGAPRLDDRLFDALPPDELSAYVLLWNMTKRPEIAAQAEKMARAFIFRGKGEARRIKKAGSGQELVEIMLNNPDPINQHLLLSRVEEKTAECLPLIIRELAAPHHTNFAELAVKAIYQSNYYPEKELLALITQPNATAYDLSLICMLLGMLEIEEAIQPLWDYYGFFKREFPRENYWKGPLTGLQDLKHRRDHPVEVPDAERKLVEESLREAGASSLASEAERIVQLIKTRRVLKAIQILADAAEGNLEQTAYTLKAIMEGLVRLNSGSTDHSERAEREGESCAG